MHYLLLTAFIIATHCILSIKTDTATIASYGQICSASPVSNLNVCNNTCSACVASSSYKCTSCNSQFTLSNQICSVDNSIHTYTVNRYLNALNANQMSVDIAKFIFADTKVALNATRTAQICKQDSYDLFIAGLFQTNEIVGLNYAFSNEIDQIQIKFSFISVISSMTLYVDINDVTYYTNRYSIFSDLGGEYGLNSTGQNYLFLTALSSTNVGSVISPVDTGVISVISKNINIQFYVKSDTNNTYSWGFNDVVVIQRSCQTCVTQEVKDLLASVVKLAYVVAIIVTILIILLFVMIKIEEIKRKLDFQNKLGASSDNLPLKAINRVVDSLQKSVRTMEKQFKKEDKRFMKVMKKA